MVADPGTVAAASVSIGQTVVAYQFFLPRLSEVRRADPGEPGMRGDVLLGQIAAAGLSVGVGGTLTWLTGSPIPLWVTIFTAVIIAAVYQFAMKDVEA